MNLSELLSCICVAADALDKRKEEVNRLNVFPVPDGDAGTNMSLTLQTVTKELQALPVTASAEDVRKAIIHGSLMGARGNSGVITSQILRGICEGATNLEDFDGPSIAAALQNAVTVAFQAVRKPVEGTILTVIRDIADAASKAVDEGKDTHDVLRAVAAEAFASVKRTPDLLPVLKENGVVDAGGFGLAIATEAFVGAVTGDGGELPDAYTFSRPEPKVEIELINDWAGSKYLYCTEFLFHGEGIDEDEVRAFLPTKGDCDLFVGSSPHYKVHVHTDHPGEVLSFMTDRGQVSEVFIHNMKLQSDERNEQLKEEDPENDEPAKPLGFVAVASGDGMAKILESLGVDLVVKGGQTMNPSTADLLDAVNKVNAEQVIILPDNGNIVMAAQSAAGEADRPCAVVPTKTVPDAFAAMLAVDPEASLEENVESMTEAFSEIVCGEVTHAIKRSKDENGKTIRKGDVIGISDGAIKVVGRDVVQVTCDLICKLVGDDDDYDTLTILAGSDLPDKEFENLVERLEEALPDFDIDQHRGDQPLYPVVFSIE